jgi:membrane protein DedA with SNARE-associated domain
MDLIIAWVSQYGYVAIFALLMFGIVGLPIPDETMLVFSGYLIAQGHLKPVPAVITAFCGSACGISLSYTIGRTLGIGFIHKYGRYVHITEARLNKVHVWFDRVGHWALFIGYYIAGVRHFTAIIAGTSGLGYRTFAAYAYPGAFMWVCTFLGLGYFFGEHWQEVSEVVHRRLLLISAIVIAAAIAYWLYRRYRRKKDEIEKPQP